jgi:peptide/nickel transport system substrate-binding protein
VTSYTPLEDLPESARELLEYNPEKAKQLLDEAGYPGPNRFTFPVLCYSEEQVDLLSIAKNDLAKIGVDLKIDVRDRTVFTSMQAAKSFKGAIMSATGSIGGPSKFTELQCGTARNYGFCDQYVDDLFTEIWAFENIGKEDVRNKACTDMTLYVLPLAINIQFPSPYEYRLWWPWVKNYHGEAKIGYTGEWDCAAFIWIDQDLREEMTGRR